MKIYKGPYPLLHGGTSKLQDQPAALGTPFLTRITTPRNTGFFPSSAWAAKWHLTALLNDLALERSILLLGRRRRLTAKTKITHICYCSNLILHDTQELGRI